MTHVTTVQSGTPVDAMGIPATKPDGALFATFLEQSVPSEQKPIFQENLSEEMNTESALHETMTEEEGLTEEVFVPDTDTEEEKKFDLPTLHTLFPYLHQVRELDTNSTGIVGEQSVEEMTVTAGTHLSEQSPVLHGLVSKNEDHSILEQLSVGEQSQITSDDMQEMNTENQLAVSMNEIKSLTNPVDFTNTTIHAFQENEELIVSDFEELTVSNKSSLENENILETTQENGFLAESNERVQRNYADLNSQPIQMDVAEDNRIVPDDSASDEQFPTTNNPLMNEDLQASSVERESDWKGLAENEAVFSQLSTEPKVTTTVKVDNIAAVMQKTVTTVVESSEPTVSSTTRIQLAPEHLGKMDITIQKDADKLTAIITVEKPASKELINKQLDHIRQNLTQLQPEKQTMPPLTIKVMVAEQMMDFSGQSQFFDQRQRDKQMAARNNHPKRAVGKLDKQKKENEAPINGRISILV